MAIQFLNVEWLDHNSERRYPLADTAGAADLTGTFALPNSFLVELDLPVRADPATSPGRFFVSNVTSFGTGYSIRVSYQPAMGSAVPAAVCVFVAATHVRNRSYPLVGVGDFSDSYGKATFGDLQSISEQPAGSWDLDFDDGRLDPDAIRPSLRGVSGIQVVNQTQVSAVLTDLVRLVAGSNCQLVPATVDGVNQITINFVDGAGTSANCNCAGANSQAPPIRTIQGVPPDSSNNVTFSGGTCQQVIGAYPGVAFSNTCAQPKYGCPELETLTKDIEFLKSQNLTLSQFGAALNAKVETFAAVVLGSKLNDSGCSTC